MKYLYIYTHAEFTLEWKLAFSALSERLDSDRPTCSKTFIFSWIIGLDRDMKEKFVFYSKFH